MTRVLLDQILLATSASLEISIVSKVTILLVFALVAVQIAKAARASLRHMLLAATFCVLAVLPLTAVVMPPVQVNIPYSVAASSTIPLSHLDTIIATGQMPVPAESAQKRGVRHIVSIASALRVVWALGMVAFLLPVVTALIRLRRIRRNALPWVDIRPMAHRLAKEVGVTRHVEVLLHEGISAPMTAGWRRPTIMLPVDASDWTETECRNAFVHELEHVRRADWATQVVGRFACALYWFHPLVWVAWRRMALNAECACDDAVLRRADAPSYAAQLVTLAQRLSHGTVQPALSMANRSDLSARVSAILSSRQHRGRAGIFRTAVIVAGALLFAVAVSPLHAVVPAQSNPLEARSQQAPEAATTSTVPSFEVSSIKINKSGEFRVSGGFLPGGRYRVTNYPLRNLIAAAYLRPQINPDFLISGGPEWMDSEHFDIDAKASTDFPPGPDGPTAPRRLMLQKLLADRFGLKVHREMTERPIYALVVARADAKPGAQLRRASANCADLVATAARTGSQAPSCGSQVGPGSVVMTGLPLAIFTNLLPRFVNRVVIDRTALAGAFDLELKWTPAPGEWVAPPLPGGAGVPPADGPSLFSALQEQLGLKLESTRGAVEVLFVDHAEMPAEN